MSITFEDATSIVGEKEYGNAPTVYFDPAKKTLKRIIQNLNIQKGSGDIGMESDFILYIENKFTSTQSSNAVASEYDASRTLPIQLTSFWGSKLPTISTNSELRFMDNYEVYEEISQKATRRLGW
jgi:hypothetical protein